MQNACSFADTFFFRYRPELELMRGFTMEKLPFDWWRLEPLDKKRADWQMRYAAVFRLNGDA